MANQNGISASDIVEFAAREGNKMISEQVNMKARLFNLLEKRKMAGKRAFINIVAGGLSSTSQVEDFGDLPTEAATDPVQGTVDAVAYVSRLGLGRIALATLAGVDDSADLLDMQLQTASNDMARQIGRAMYGSTLAIPSVGTNTVTQAGGSGTAVTMTVVFSGGLSDFREGEAYVFEAAAVTTGSYPVVCTNVAVTSALTATVTFVAGPAVGVPGYQTATFANNLIISCGGTAGGSDGDIAVGDRFFLLGSRAKPTPGSAATGLVTRAAANASLVSLETIVGTGSLHGIASGTLGWTGVDFAAALPSAQTFMAASALMQARGGESATHLVLSHIAAAAYASAQISAGAVGFGNTALVQPRWVVSGKLDQLGKGADQESGLSMFGRPVVIDNNCPVASGFLINKDYLHIGEWQKLQAEDEGGSPLLLSRTTFSKEVQYSCIYNMICRKRNAHARQTITLA